jgi:hypothetical protein
VDIITRALPVTDLGLQGDGRTAVLRLLSYAQDYTVSDDGAHTYTERWASGAFRRSFGHAKNAVKVPLTYEHPSPVMGRALPVGGSTRAWEDGDAVMVEGRISRTQAGDDLVELLRDGVVQGVSVEATVFRSKAMVGGFERQEAALRAVAFTCYPQYADAGLVAMRAEILDETATPRLTAVAARFGTVFAEL